MVLSIKTTRVNETIKLEASEVLALMGLTVSDTGRLMRTPIAKEKSFTWVSDLMADLNVDN